MFGLLVCIHFVQSVSVEVWKLPVDDALLMEEKKTDGYLSSVEATEPTQNQQHQLEEGREKGQQRGN